MTSLMQIGEAVRQARERQKLFKTRLAENIGVHRNTLQQLEHGTGNVELNTLIAVCDALGLEIQLVPKQVAMLAGEMVPTQSALNKMLEERLGPKGGRK